MSNITKKTSFPHGDQKCPPRSRILDILSPEWFTRPNTHTHTHTPPTFQHAETPFNTRLTLTPCRWLGYKRLRNSDEKHENILLTSSEAEHRQEQEQEC